MKKTLLLLLAPLWALWAQAQTTTDILDSFGVTGWSSTYDSTTHTITYESAWTGRGWWFGGTDFSEYSKIVIEFEECNIGGQVVIQYVNSEGEINAATAFSQGASSVEAIFDADYKSNVDQIYIQCGALTDNPTIVLKAAYLVSGEDTSNVIWEGEQVVNWWDNAVHLSVESLANAVEGATMAVTYKLAEGAEEGCIKIQSLNTDWSQTDFTSYSNQENVTDGALNFVQDGVLSFVINAEDAALIQSDIQYVMIVGSDCIVTKVEIFPGSIVTLDPIDVILTEGDQYEGISVSVDSGSIIEYLDIPDLHTNYMEVYAVQGDELSDNYTSGGNAGFWFDKLGTVCDWGADNCAISVEFYNEEELFSISQYPGTLVEGDVVKVTIALVTNDNRVYIPFVITCGNDPSLIKDVVYNISVSGSAPVNNDYTETYIAFDVQAAADAIGVESLADAQVVLQNPDGTFISEKTAENGFWISADGTAVYWTDADAYWCVEYWADDYPNSIAICQFPERITETTTFNAKFGFWANQKVALVDVTYVVTVEEDPIPSYTAIGHVTTFIDEDGSAGWGDNLIPECDATIECTNTTVTVRGLAGVEGYDFVAEYDAEGNITSLTPIENSEAGDTVTSGYANVYTGLEDIYAMQPYIGSGYGYVVNNGDSGYLLLGAYFYDQEDNATWGAYYVEWNINYTPRETCSSPIIKYNGRYAEIDWTETYDIHVALDDEEVEYAGGALDITGAQNIKAWTTKSGYYDSEVIAFDVPAYFDGKVATVYTPGGLRTGFSWANDMLDDLVSIEVKGSINDIDAELIGDLKSLGAIKWNCDNYAVPAGLFDYNPNILVYVDAASKAQNSGVRNVVVNGNASEITLDDTGNFYVPEAFEADSISYTHNYSMETALNGNTLGWETIALPFAPKLIMHEDGSELRPFAALPEGDYSEAKPIWLYEMSDTGWVAVDSIAANAPYLISIPNNKNYGVEYQLSGDVTFSASAVTVPVTATNVAEWNGYNFVPTTVLVAASDGVAPINRLEEYNGYAAGSAFIPSMRDVQPFEAYLTAGNGSRMNAPVRISDIGETTGLQFEARLGDDADWRVWAEGGVLYIAAGEAQRVTIYNAQGMAVRVLSLEPGINEVRNLAPAIYLVHNTKVFVK